MIAIIHTLLDEVKASWKKNLSKKDKKKVKKNNAK